MNPTRIWKPTEHATTLEDHLGAITTLVDNAWWAVLTQYWSKHEKTRVTPEMISELGSWLIPPHSYSKGKEHRLFRWRGEIIFEGWVVDGPVYSASKYVIHSYEKTPH